jgi:hypothetical protein
MELTEGLLMLQFCPVTQIAGFDIDANVAGHLWPPIIARYELQGLEVACMSSNARIMVLFNDTALKVSVIRARSVKLSLSPCPDPWSARLESVLGLPILQPGLW